MLAKSCMQPSTPSFFEISQNILWQSATSAEDLDKIIEHAVLSGKSCTPNPLSLENLRLGKKTLAWDKVGHPRAEMEAKTCFLGPAREITGKNLENKQKLQ